MSGCLTCGGLKTLSSRPDAFRRRLDNSAAKTKTPQTLARSLFKLGNSYEAFLTTFSREPLLFFPWPQATHYTSLSGPCFTPVVLCFATNVPFTSVKERLQCLRRLLNSPHWQFFELP